MLLEGIIGAEAENEESEMAFVVGEGVIRPTDCNHKMIFNGLFHRNRNTPNSRLLILNRTLNGQEDSEKEEHSWRHLPLRLQTTSRPRSNHHSEELAGTQTHGLQERIESPGMNPLSQDGFHRGGSWEVARTYGLQSPISC